MINLTDFIEIRKGQIENAPDELGVNAIVNAGKPTLMGNADGVDGAIHKKVAKLNGQQSDYLKREIKKQINHDENAKEDQIRCKRGEVVLTSGYQLCDWILHTVGPESDAKTCRSFVCSSSKIEILEDCYKNIVLEVLKHPEIETVAVPVIGAGNYHIDFELAFKVGLATLYNTMLEIKQRDIEFFEYINLRKIYFVLLEQENVNKAIKIYNKFKLTFEKGKRVVYRNSWESQKELLKEIRMYDECRGYFSIAKAFRILLVLIRMFLFPMTYLKDMFGEENWEVRRRTVEIITFLKLFIPILGYYAMKDAGGRLDYMIIGFFMFYCLLDTITYLLSLIILADIQRPSANIIRSILMLFINYFEVSMDISMMYYILYYGKIKFREAMAFGMISETVKVAPTDMWGEVFDYSIRYLNQGVKFFFLTIVLGYFANHLHQRKFMNANEK